MVVRELFFSRRHHFPFAHCAIGIFPKVTEFASPSRAAAKESPSFLQLVIKDADVVVADGERAKIQKFFVFICLPSVIYGTLLAPRR